MSDNMNGEKEKRYLNLNKLDSTKIIRLHPSNYDYFLELLEETLKRERPEVNIQQIKCLLNLIKPLREKKQNVEIVADICAALIEGQHIRFIDENYKVLNHLSELVKNLDTQDRQREMVSEVREST